MPYRPKDIYRGRRKFRVPLIVGLFVLAALLLGAIVMFYVLQQFLVYDQTGVKLELPFMKTEETEPAPAEETPIPFEPVEVQVVYDEPDFSAVDLGGWEELAPTRARFIPFSEAADEMKLTAALQSLDSDYTGVVLEVKGRDGYLSWNSRSDMAVGYGTAGTMDYTEAIADLHERGLTAAAQLCCCADALLAERNSPITLKTPDGRPYTDENGVRWLDPYNRSLRAYLADLVAELADMGFDEIILADLYHPYREGYGGTGDGEETSVPADTGFLYSVTIQTEPSPVNAVCQMGRRLAETLEDVPETAVSVLLDRDSLLAGNGARTGQDIGIFWRLFARLYCPCETWDAPTVLEYAGETLNGGSAGVRFVPVCDYEAPEGFDSCVIRVPAQG